MSFLEDLGRAVGLGGSRPASTSLGLHSARRFRVLVERERARVHRCDDQFSLLAFAVADLRSGWPTLVKTAKILRRRLRITDDAGWLNRGTIGVLLPGTPGWGAWTMADDVCASLPLGIPLPECRVSSYPSDWLPGRSGKEDRGERAASRPPQAAGRARGDAAGASDAALEAGVGHRGSGSRPAAALAPVARGGGRRQAHFAGPGALCPASQRTGRKTVPDVQVPHHDHRRRSPQGLAAGARTSRTGRPSRSRTIPASRRWAAGCGPPASTSCHSCGTCSAAICRWSGRGRCPARKPRPAPTGAASAWTQFPG